MRIAYFVHDLSDAAVHRRVRMLHAAGAEVLVLGFRRTATPPRRIDGAVAVDLGRTFDGRFTQRTLGVARQVLRAPLMKREIRGCDVVIGRTLEAFTVAAAARGMHAPGARLVYECLDVHRFMLSRSWLGRALRGLERAMLSRAHLLILSSPGHLRAYFQPMQGVGRTLGVPVIMVENKVLDLDGAPAVQPEHRSPGPPWRIGWFGMLRCRKSFEILCDLARSRPETIQVVIRGRPSDKEFPHFEAEVARAPAVAFEGAYSSDELMGIYQDVHFSWAIDYFEEGANSEWLLPNRIYEGGRYGAVPIALRRAETGRWLDQRGLGLLVDDPVRELEPLLAGLDAEGYRALEDRGRSAPSGWFTAGPADCGCLVKALAAETP